MESVLAECECCGLTEECTPAYINDVRERYEGKWMCGLCGEAVKDEIVRGELRQGMISTEEAMATHMRFCRSPLNPAVHLISAMKQILRRSLENNPNIRLGSSQSCITGLSS